MSTFTPEELNVLKQFYGRVPARQIRAGTGIDPWLLVARHRALPQAEFEAVKRDVTA
jgi:hypothetical protein